MSRLRFDDGSWREQVLHQGEKIMHWRRWAEAVEPDVLGTGRPWILIAKENPSDLIAATIAALESGATIVLGNPHWPATVWQEVLQLSQPDLVWVDGAILPHPFPHGELPPSWEPGQRGSMAPGSLLIATGGSSGTLRFAHHTWSTITAAVTMVQAWIQEAGLALGQPDPSPIHCFCTLPLYHVSGWMQVARSFLTHGQLQLVPFGDLFTEWQTLLQSPGESVPSWLQIPPQHYCLSLVPTQLQRLLNLGLSSGSSSVLLDWLRDFKVIFVGGAGLSADLYELARSAQLPLAPTYGMTETAGMVATLTPREFLENRAPRIGESYSVGRSLPGVTVSFQPWSESSSPSTLPPQFPCALLQITAPTLALGYWPPTDHGFYDHESQRSFITQDLGWQDDRGYLYLLGRSSRLIISGGENVFPEQVERVIRQTGLVMDVAVVGVPDPDWGERVVAVYVPHVAGLNDPDQLQAWNPKDWDDRLATLTRPHLTPPQRPKTWTAVIEIPRNGQGKVNPQELLALVQPSVGQNTTYPSP